MRGPGLIIGGTLDGVAAIFVAAYLAAVVYQGNANVKALGAQLMKDGPGFLEWLVAVYVLSLLVNLPGGAGRVFTGLVFLAIIGLTIKLMTRGGADVLRAFGAGQISLFQAVAKLATN